MVHARAGDRQQSPAGVLLACCVPAALLLLNRQWWLLLQMLLLLGPLMAFLSPSFLQQLKMCLRTLKSGVPASLAPVAGTDLAPVAATQQGAKPTVGCMTSLLLSRAPLIWFALALLIVRMAQGDS